MGTLRIRIRYVRKIVCWLLLVLTLSCCRLNEAKTPEQWFDFTWSGLAGCDALTFRGLASLQRGDDNVLEESLSYTGQLQEHRKLSIVTESSGGKSTASGSRLQTDGMAKAAGLEAKLRWENGNWLVQSPDSNALMHGMARLNPLEQMEEIRAATKEITAESGAARGTEVLRIELDPAEASIRLKDRLLSEMNLLRQGWDDKLENVPADKRERLLLELSSIWTTGNEQLLQMLEHMESKVIYHLTVDRKSGLPARLTSETTLDYLSPQGIKQREVLRTDSQLEGYK